jgi:hypothetical protein
MDLSQLFSLVGGPKFQGRLGDQPSAGLDTQALDQVFKQAQQNQGALFLLPQNQKSEQPGYLMPPPYFSMGQGGDVTQLPQPKLNESPFVLPQPGTTKRQYDNPFAGDTPVSNEDYLNLIKQMFSGAKRG